MHYNASGVFMPVVSLALALFLIASAGLGASSPTTRCVDDYGAVGDGAADDTHAIQKAVDDGYDGVWSHPVRVLFSPGKSYRVSSQIVLWAGVQLETDASNPATIVLGANTPGYGDPTRVKHVFTSRLSAARPDCEENPDPFPRDPIAYYRGGNLPFPGWPWQWPADYDSARYDQNRVHPGFGAGNNFGSQIRNLKFRVEPGNSGAGLIHYINAQGSLLHNLDFDLGDARYGISGGNLIVGCKFRGGQYGLHEPPILEHGMILNCRFENQHTASYWQDGGATRTWIGCHFAQTNTALQVQRCRILVMIGCSFDRAQVGIAMNSLGTRVLIQNLQADHVRVLFASPKQIVEGNPDGRMVLPTFVQGETMVDGQWLSEDGVVPATTKLPTWCSVPDQFDLTDAANVKEFGAAGDGVADDTDALRRAIAAHDIVFLPAGTYRLSDTVVLRSKTQLVGEHHQASILAIAPAAPGFTNPANPKPVLDTPDDAEAEVHIARLSQHVLGHGNGGNDGAIGLRWRVGRKSSVSSGQYTLGSNPLYVTGNGGGTFLNVWTANDGQKGLVVERNRQPIVFYGFCSEHQQDKAIHCIGARDVTFYATGGGEGHYPANMTMNQFDDCDRMAWIQAVAHPTDDHYPEIEPGQMVILKVTNTPNLWIGPLMRIHGEPVRHTVLDLRPDGQTVGVGNREFTLYRFGELAQPDGACADGHGSH